MEAVLAEPIVDEDERLNLAEELIDAIRNEDKESIDSTIIQLAHTHETSLFNEIGQITRHVHDALGFCSDNERISEIAKNEIPDARERLQYVIEKTEKSANTTLDIAEELLKDSNALATESEGIQHKWYRFKKREMNVEEFRELSQQLESFFTRIDEDSNKFRSDISDLMVAQDFQDLTGQIIKQVIDLVVEVESRLVGVIKNAGPEQAEKKVQTVKDIKAEGPQVNAKGDANIAADQEDVDALLSSLGF